MKCGWMQVHLYKLILSPIPKAPIFPFYRAHNTLLGSANKLLLLLLLLGL
jgi:hypothetical protein